jgi:hypothetical protein
MDEQDFARHFPFVFHTTPRRHLQLIQRDKVLFSAKTLIIQAEGKYAPRLPRACRQELRFPDGSVRVLRDQEPPLRPGQIELERGFTLEALSELIDSHVLFWPREADGLTTSSKYQNEERVILRIPTADLFAANALPMFCKYNSGAGRATSGRPSPRGPKLFVGPGAFRAPISAVREVGFKIKAVLPETTTVSVGSESRWSRLAARGE